MPTPASPLVVPSYTQNRGSVFIDPLTKSTLQVASVYREDDVCGDPAYIVFGQSMTINQLISCTPVLAGTLSISGRIPTDGDAADLTTMSDFLVGSLGVAIAALAP